jgi:dTDP-4-dehydrorhamnose 3,5-epimerase
LDEIKKLEVSVTKLPKIDQDNGQVMHGIKASDINFVGFGEAYFSTVAHKKTKGWKLHKKMTLNLLVPHGEIRIIVHDGFMGNDPIIPILDITLGKKNYSRISVPPGYWVAFTGISQESNILLNIASIEHDPSEAINKPLNFFKVNGFE